MEVSNGMIQSGEENNTVEREQWIRKHWREIAHICKVKVKYRERNQPFSAQQIIIILPSQLSWDYRENNEQYPSEFRRFWDVFFVIAFRAFGKKNNKYASVFFLFITPIWSIVNPPPWYTHT